MNSKAYFEEEILKRAAELNSQDDTLCIGKLSLSAYSSSARAAMLTQHLVQAVVPDYPEIPAVGTGHEHLFGKYSSSYKKTDTKTEVIHKIVKFKDYVYTLVTYDSKKNEYDIIQRNEVKSMAESYGFRYNNKEIDKYEPGDTIKKDTMLYCSPTMDEFENFRYGVNAKVAYVISQDTIEDAVKMRKGFAKKLSFTKVEQCKIPFNDNDIPLNLYGDIDNYKSFPEIGEYTKKSILCATRRRNKATDQYSLKNNNLKKIFPNDDIFQTHGSYQIVDINIWCNKEYDEIPDLPAYSQIKSYYKKILDYWKEVNTVFGDIINSAKNKGHSYSQELSRLYAKSRDILDPACKWTEADRMFSNMIIEFTFAKSEPVRNGSKITGRFGNKSIVARVVDDEEMGMTDDGTIIDIQIDALGILARLNSGQLFEQELNWVAQFVKGYMSELKDNDERYNLLCKFLKMTNVEEYNELKEFYEKLSKQEKIDFIQSILDDRIYMIQSPSRSITGEGMRQLYDEFQPKKSTITLRDKDGEYKVVRQMIVADEYIMRLKHEAIGKFSVRSKSLINPRSFLPIKSLKSKKHKSIYADQANRVNFIAPSKRKLLVEESV